MLNRWILLEKVLKKYFQKQMFTSGVGSGFIAFSEGGGWNHQRGGRKVSERIHLSQNMTEFSLTFFHLLENFFKKWVFVVYQMDYSFFKKKNSMAYEALN